jgi:ABC-type antimicrobial peptide transport system permease subunit
MGIRIALGATPKDIFRLVVGQGVRVVGIGTGIGICVALVLTFLLSRLISSIRPLDPLTYVGVIGVLAFVALAASYMPARRAVNTDPMVALRSE